MVTVIVILVVIIIMMMAASVVLMVNVIVILVVIIAFARTRLVSACAGSFSWAAPLSEWTGCSRWPRTGLRRSTGRSTRSSR